MAKILSGLVALAGAVSAALGIGHSGAAPKDLTPTDVRIAQVRALHQNDRSVESRASGKEVVAQSKDEVKWPRA